MENFSEKIYLYCTVREHQQKTFVKLLGFWSLIKGLGGGGLSESIKKGTFVMKIFFFPVNIE